jgi:hypothetical protein
MRQLAINEIHEQEVDPRSLYHPSGIEITPGARYRISARGRWKDWFIECGPEGWHGLILQAWNRLPWQPFFLLCGTVGQGMEHAFAIGNELPDWVAPDGLASSQDRQLYFFANDWMSQYCNNHPVEDNPLRVTLTRLS